VAAALAEVPVVAAVATEAERHVVEPPRSAVVLPTQATVV
jgi:hypothetical protein